MKSGKTDYPQGFLLALILPRIKSEAQNASEPGMSSLTQLVIVCVRLYRWFANSVVGEFVHVCTLNFWKKLLWILMEIFSLKFFQCMYCQFFIDLNLADSNKIKDLGLRKKIETKNREIRRLGAEILKNIG